MELPSDEHVSRIVAATLALTRGGRATELGEIASKARSSATVVRMVLAKTLGQINDESLSLSTLQRLGLARGTIGQGTLGGVARTLTWQEFEKFVEECLLETHFATERNVRVNGAGRAWQIDIVGTKGQLLLCFDCKHWKPPNSLSRFDKAADHQKKATAYLTRSAHSTVRGKTMFVALPLILTLQDPPRTIYNHNVLLSIDQLPDFLRQVTPFTPGLPFLALEREVKENPIKRALAQSSRSE